MTTTTINNGGLPIQPLAHYNLEVAQRVQGWLDSGITLAWIPILSQENFPQTPRHILQDADANQATLRLPIHQPSDLLDLPEGVTGWLLPFDAENTDVVCGVWDGEVYILGVQDKRSGHPQTLLDGCADNATDAANRTPQSAV